MEGQEGLRIKIAQGVGAGASLLGVHGAEERAKLDGLPDEPGTGWKAEGWGREKDGGGGTRREEGGFGYFVI